MATDHIIETLDREAVVERVCPQYEAIMEYGREAEISPKIEGRIVRPDELSQLSIVHHAGLPLAGEDL